jgi:hypothetical protein
MQRHYVNYYKGEQLYETNRRKTALTHPRSPNSKLSNKNKCVSADLMHLFLVCFVTVRLTYIFIDYPDCEYIIILNTSIVIYDFWRLNNVNTLPWPSRSPDLVPIEHVWDMLNRRIRENHHPFNSLQELENTLIIEWNAIPQYKIKKKIIERHAKNDVELLPTGPALSC